MNKLYFIFLLFLTSCATPKLDYNAPKVPEFATTIPATIKSTTDSIKSSAKVIIEEASALPKDSHSGKVIIEAGKIQTAANNLDDVIVKVQHLTSAMQENATNYKKVVEQLDAVQDSNKKLTKEVLGLKADVAEEKAKYDNAWLGGKTWKLIFGVAGVAVGLVILDAVLYFVLGFGINPLTIFLGLIGRIFGHPVGSGAFLPKKVGVQNPYLNSK